MNHVIVNCRAFPYGLTAGDVSSVIVYLMTYSGGATAWGRVRAVWRELERRYT